LLRSLPFSSPVRRPLFAARFDGYCDSLTKRSHQINAIEAGFRLAIVRGRWKLW
jgi:hypothetical protein